MATPTRIVDIDELIASLPRNEQVMVKRLRALVKECIPQATEKAYYDLQIPFYTRNRLICFIWPPSLTSPSGKQVYAMYFRKPQDIDEAQVKALLYEAAMIDEQFAKKKRKV